MKLKYYLRLLWDASQLDIFDLAYEFSSEELNLLTLGGFWETTNGIPRRGIGVRIAIFLLHFYQSIVEYWRRSGAAILPGGLVFFALSKNEIDSIKPVCSQIADAYLTGGKETPFPFPFAWAYALACPYLPLVVINLLRARGYKRRSFGYIFDHYWLSYGLYIAARIWLRKIGPKAIITSNEAYTYHRVMLKAGLDQGIRTVHIQHATNPENLAPLTHDFALLEGRDNLNKVARCGPTRTRIFLVGMPKHDPHFHHINVQREARTIGICTNMLDPLAQTEQLLARIRRESSTLQLLLRPHNADLRFRDWEDMAKRHGLIFSDSKTELAFDFLKRVDAIIAGDSNILLEAALMNVVPLCYDFAQAHLDWYGFQQNGLVEYFSELDPLTDRIRELCKNKPDVRTKAGFYCATIGTCYDGHSGELAAALIQSIGSKNDIDLSLWKRIPEIALEAYRINNGN